MDRQSDDVDAAADLAARERETMIARARSKIGSCELTPSGECHWCGADVSKPRLFCDSNCAKSWQEFERRKSRR